MQYPPLSVYIHIPWCIHKCPYCDFNSHEFKDQNIKNNEEAYTHALLKQIENYKRTMHKVMNVQGEWNENVYKGETYCIASHMFDQDDKPYKLDMGIIYSDVIEIREETPKFTSRTFSLQWKKTDILDLPEQN